MAKEYIDFDKACQQVAGKLSGRMQIALRDKTKLKLSHFKPVSHDDSVYMSPDHNDPDLCVVIDADMKAFFDKCDTMSADKSLEDYNKFCASWTSFYFRMFGQIDSEMTTRLARSTSWLDVAQQQDPGMLMTLLQTIRIHGSDRDYPPERIA